MTPAVERMPGGPAEQHRGSERPQQAGVEHEPERQHEKENERNSQRMAKPDWQQRQPDDPLAAAVETKSGGKQPAPRRGDAGKQAGGRDPKPGPGIAQYGRRGRRPAARMGKTRNPRDRP